MNYYNTVNVRYSGENFVTNYFLQSKVGSSGKIIVFDIGSHKGEYTDMILDNKSNLNVDFHLFEPRKVCYNYLKDHFKTNPNVLINNCAVSLINSVNTKLYSINETTRVATLFDFEEKYFFSEKTLDSGEQVTVINLLNYCNKKDINYIDLIKVDIEGEEYNCLQTMKDFIDKDKIGMIQFEYCFLNAYRKHSFLDFWELLHEKYRIYRICIDGLFPIDSYHFLLECNIPINYLAVARKEIL